MKNTFFKRTLGISMLAVMVAVPALAQMGSGPNGPGMMGGYGRGGGNGPAGGWHMWGGGPGGGMWGGPDAMTSRIDGRLAFLKTELKITDAQGAAWNKVAEAVRASSKSMVDRMNAVFATDQKAKTLPERLDVQEQFMMTRLDEIKQIKAAFKDLYAVLNDDQKKEADSLVLPMMGMGMTQGGWGMGPGMWNR